VAVHLVAVLDGLVAHCTGLCAVELRCMSGAQLFHHGSEALTRPLQQLPQAVDGHPVVTVVDAVTGGLELRTESLRL
jgi:hypothetical protein